MECTGFSTEKGGLMHAHINWCHGTPPNATHTILVSVILPFISPWIGAPCSGLSGESALKSSIRGHETLIPPLFFFFFSCIHIIIPDLNPNLSKIKIINGVFGSIGETTLYFWKSKPTLFFRTEGVLSSNQHLIWRVKIGVYMFFWVHRGSWLLWLQIMHSVS